MKKYFIGILVLVLFASLTEGTCGASEEEIKSEIAELKARILSLEAKLEKQETATLKQEKKIGHFDDHLLHKGLGTEIAEGLQIGASATGIVQGTINANNNAQKDDDSADASYSVDLELEKAIGDAGSAFIHLEAGEGDTVEGELDVFSNVNRDAGDSNDNVQVTEAWYEHKFFGEKLALCAGKLDATSSFDENAIAHDETRQFLGRIFRNSPVIEFPDNGPGVRANIYPTDRLELAAGYFDGDNDWEDMGDNPFIFGQINFKPGFLEKEGNYRFYGWYNDTYHTKLKNTLKTKEPGYGLGLSFDQELTDSVVGFVRFGWEDEEVYNLDFAWSTGLQISGTYWDRENDVLGLAVGQAMPGDDYKDAASGRNANNEGHFEAYYSIYVNDHLKVSPDIQVIWNPSGDDPTNGWTDTITVLGVRSQVDF